jgi:CHAT domain-containing protein
MSLEEAKKVTLSIGDKTFVPSPRSIDDIIALLNQQHLEDNSPRFQKLLFQADSSPPENADYWKANFYLHRGDAALKLGRFKQALVDFRSAFHFYDKQSHYPDKNGKLRNKLTWRLGTMEYIAGNFKYAIRILEEGVKKKIEEPAIYAQLVKLYAFIGDLESAKKIKKQGLVVCNQLRDKKGWKIWSQVHAARIEAIFLEAQGKYKEAEIFRRKQLDLTSLKDIFYVVHARIDLAKNLMKQKRLVEAEIEARQALKEGLIFMEKNTGDFATLIVNFGNIIQHQGRLKDAENLIRTGIDILEKTNISSSSFLQGQSRVQLGNVLVYQKKYVAAMEQFNFAKKAMQPNQYIYNRNLSQNPNLTLALLMTGRTKEAISLINHIYDFNRTSFGATHYLTAEILGLRAVAHFSMKRYKLSLDDFSHAVPILLERENADADDYSKNFRLKIIIESYLDLLSQLHGGQLDTNIEIMPLVEAFKLAGVISDRAVQSAIGAGSARAAAAEYPDLADLIRREQDTRKQIDVMQASLAAQIAAPLNQQLPSIINNLKNEIANLRKAQTILINEIEKRFPKYADFTNPQLISLSQVKSKLHSSEVLIYIYSTDRNTFVWAIPPNRPFQCSIVPIGKNDLQKRVARIRNALSIEPSTFGDIPEFDLRFAYHLYSKLLKPVESVWKDAQELIIVAPGPLGQLPFSVLPTARIALEKEKNELFANYREVPWLIRRVSITRHPSVSSFVTLRALPEGDATRKAFIGFGDPIFNKAQLAQTENIGEGYNKKYGYKSRGLSIRGIRTTEMGHLDSKQIISSQLSHLIRLPDTAEEIKSMAQAMGADPIHDIYLMQNASEGKVKKMDLSDRRVIAFASHGLVPGDLDGLYQPALALSAPSVTGDAEDGLLTLGEILKLKLNADWVILSACNTGSADGANSEAVSGLGRAFFYAGTRAILVSMWAVETTSARNLTTGVLSHQKEDENLTRAKALQKSILELIDKKALRDKNLDTIVASYAHPFFWAPFIIVGESGDRAN